MLHIIAKDKELLSEFIKLAQRESKSTKISNIFEQLVKIAQTDYKQMIDKLELSLKDELGRPGSFESKINTLENMVGRNKAILASYMYESAYNEQIADTLMKTFFPNLSERIVKYLEDYNGAKNSDKFQLKGVLNSILERAKYLSVSRSVRKERREVDTVSVDAPLKDGRTREVADVRQMLDMVPADPAEKSKTLESVFSTVIKNPEFDILSFYILNTFLPKYKEIKNKLNSTTGQAQIEAELEFDKFYDYVVDFIKSNIKENKRVYEQKGQRREFTLDDVQEATNSALKQINLDYFVEKILSSKYYKLPRFVKNFDPVLVKETIKALIKSSIIMNTKSRLNVPFAQAEKGEQGGRRRLSQIELMYRLIEKGIMNVAENEDEQERLLREALVLLGSRSEGGNIMHKPKDFTDYALFQHATPMLISGMLQEYEEKYGADFADLPTEIQQSIINEIHSRVYPHMPHSYKEPGKKEFTRKEYHKMGEEAESLTKKHLLERLQKAQRVYKGESPYGTAFDPDEEPLLTLNPEESLNKQSALDQLIKKYASKN